MYLSLISINSLLFIILLLIIIGIIEIQVHHKSLSHIPIRVHVNGIRGKSSVVRLIAAGLRGGGLKTFAKTTGTVPRIINEHGDDVELHRLRSASIGEQLKLIRYFATQSADAVVMECMAINPQYQWISEHKMVRSTLGVITNVRKDHMDEMGKTNEQIAYSLSNSIPFESTLITSEKKWFGPLAKISNERKTEFIISDNNDIDSEFIDNFPYLEHPENINLALKVCEKLGIDKKDALNGMMSTKPDPGVLLIWKICNENQFVSAFAANDPVSTLKVWNLIKDKSTNNTCFFLNSRDDRRYRTKQLIKLVMEDIKPDLLIIRADNIKHLIVNYDTDTKIKLFSMRSSQKEVANYIVGLNKYIIVGIGNIVGWGDSFIERIKQYRI